MCSHTLNCSVYKILFMSTVLMLGYLSVCIERDRSSITATIYNMPLASSGQSLSVVQLIGGHSCVRSWCLRKPGEQVPLRESWLSESSFTERISAKFTSLLVRLTQGQMANRSLPLLHSCNDVENSENFLNRLPRQVQVFAV